MNRDPRFALSQELEAKQTLLDQLRALAAEDSDFLTDLLEGETKIQLRHAPREAAAEDQLWPGTNPKSCSISDLLVNSARRPHRMCLNGDCLR